MLLVAVVVCSVVVNGGGSGREGLLVLLVTRHAVDMQTHDVNVLVEIVLLQLDRQMTYLGALQGLLYLYGKK